MSNIYVAVTIDVEPDCSADWSRSSPLTFKSVTDGIPNLLQPIFSKAGVAPTYFLSPEIIKNDNCIPALLSLKGKKEFGVHLHPEFVEPEKDLEESGGKKSEKFACLDYSDDIEFEKLKNITSSFKKRIGFNPTSYRAGRFGADLSSVNSLTKLGYLVDSSVTPHVDWRRKNGPNFRDFPEQPYFVDSKDFGKKGVEKEILEVPVSISGKRFPFLPSKWFYYSWLRPSLMTVLEQKLLIRRFLKKFNSNQNIFFCMMFHSVEIIPGVSPYSKREKDSRKILKRIEAILNFFNCLGAKFTTLSEFHSIMKENK